MKKNSGMPEKEGWYLVDLIPGTMGEDMPYDVDRFIDGEWEVWGDYVIKWTELP